MLRGAGAAFAYGRPGWAALTLLLATWSGKAFAGTAPLVGTWYNPATMSYAARGVTIEINATAIWGTSIIDPRSAANGFIPDLLARGGSGNTNRPIVVPASLAVYRVGDWAFGLATGSYYTQESRPNSNWAGMLYARDSRIYSYNLHPQVAYRLTDRISVGAGLQIQFIEARLSQAFPLSPSLDNLAFTGSSVAYGFVAGVSAVVTPRLQMGIGYRSAVDQKLVGTISRPEVPSMNVPAFAGPATIVLPMPDSVNVSGAYRWDAATTLLGLIEWTRWSRFGILSISVEPAGVPGVPTRLSILRRDTLALFGGVQYRVQPDLTLRAGLRYEQSSSTDATRSPSSPTANNFRSTLGLTYDVDERLSVDVYYQHSFERHIPVDILPGHPSYSSLLGTFSGNATLGADALTIGLRYHWGR